MIVITAHLNADFDCLASMAAVHKLHPSAILLFPGSQEKNVRDYLEKTGYQLPIRKLKNFDLKKIRKLVIVDNSYKKRLGPLEEVSVSPNVELEIYDHHPESTADLHSALGRVEQCGATITIITEILRERKIEISPEDATLFMLGIYEDTGSLTFSSTCEQDFCAAKWLLGKGANLNIVADFLHRHLNAQQVAILHELLGRLEIHRINGVEIALASATSKLYMGGLALVIHTLMDMENLPAVFVMVETQKSVNLLARSRIPALDVGAITSVFGGGGHATAASANIRDMLLEEARNVLLKELEKRIPPAPTVAQLMVAPVISVTKNKTLVQVKTLFDRGNVSAMPVLDGERAVGIITREIVEKVVYHKLGEEKVENYMQTDFMQVTPDTPSNMLEEIVIQQKQKIVPVKDENGFISGIVSRTDVIRAMYGDMLKSPAHMFQPSRKTGRPVAQDLSHCIKDRISADIVELLEKIAVCADECGFSAYAVGGFVRDLFIRRRNKDVDIVIEGDGIKFARRFTEKHGGRVKAHKKFQTAVVVLANKRKLDVATARTEYYTEPAALPIVEMSSIKNDLYRRDFTINSMAIKLNGADKNHLIDFFGGRRDMKDGVLRVLHNLSFVEDPTRLFRAIRFEQRFQFAIGGQTEKLLKLAVTKKLIDKISGARLFGELQRIFSENQPSKAMQRMQEFGLWKLIHPGIGYDEKMNHLCGQAEEAIAWHKLSFDTERIRPWFVYLLCISSTLGKAQTQELAIRLGFDPRPAKRILDARGQVAKATGQIKHLTPEMSVEIYEALNELTPDVLLAVMASTGDRRGKRVIAEFLSRLRYLKPRVNGNDLMRAGIEKGPLMGRVIRALEREVLKNELPDREDEIRFAKNFYRLLNK